MASRVAIVTGASSGIGKATAELLRRRGLTVVGLCRRPMAAWHVRCDVGNQTSVARAFRLLLQRFGRVDVLVNCAGIVTTTDPLSVTVREWAAILQTNLVGTYLCMKYALKAMRRQGKGRIVNLASIAARGYSRSASLPYTCSKYAVVGLTRQLAARFGREGITVNCVCPSETDTEMLRRVVPAGRRRAIASTHPLGRLGRPEEVAAVVAFLASDEASYVNGAIVDVNGGLK